MLEYSFNSYASIDAFDDLKDLYGKYLKRRVYAALESFDREIPVQRYKLLVTDKIDQASEWLKQAGTFALNKLRPIPRKVLDEFKRKIAPLLNRAGKILTKVQLGLDVFRVVAAKNRNQRVAAFDDLIATGAAEALTYLSVTLVLERTIAPI